MYVQIAIDLEQSSTWFISRSKEYNEWLYQSWNSSPASSPLPQVLHFGHYPAVNTGAGVTRRCWGGVAVTPSTSAAGGWWWWTSAGTWCARRTKVLAALFTAGSGRRRAGSLFCWRWRRRRREITISHNLMSWFGRIKLGFGGSSTRWTWRRGRRRWLLLWLVVVECSRVLMIWPNSFTSAWRRTRKFGWLDDLLGSTGLRRSSGYCCRPWNDWRVGWRGRGRDWITSSHLFGFIFPFFKRNVELYLFLLGGIWVVGVLLLLFYELGSNPFNILIKLVLGRVFTASGRRGRRRDHTLIPVTVLFQSIQDVLCVRVDKVSPRFPQWVDDIVNKSDLCA